jgi:hypothetical protein
MHSASLTCPLSSLLGSQIDRSSVWAQAASAAQSLSAASLEAAAEKVQQEAEAAGKAALASGLERRQAGLAQEDTQGGAGESATRLLLATHRIREALAEGKVRTIGA